MLDIDTLCYKDLFRKESRNGCSLSQDFFAKEDLVTPADNSMLEAQFTEAEIKQAVVDSYADRDPGPDGIPFLLYQQFWEVVKSDLNFEDFHKGRLDQVKL
jgi:hypothetical protein